MPKPDWQKALMAPPVATPAELEQMRDNLQAWYDEALVANLTEPDTDFYARRGLRVRYVVRIPKEG